MITSPLFFGVQTRTGRARPAHPARLGTRRATLPLHLPLLRVQRGSRPRGGARAGAAARHELRAVHTTHQGHQQRQAAAAGVS